MSNEDELPVDELVLDTLSGSEQFDATERLHNDGESEGAEFERIPTTKTIEVPSVTSGKSTIEIVDRLASGGLADIFTARQSPFGRDVAVKCRRSDRGQEHDVDILYREGVLTGYLDHPNIVSVYEITTRENGEPGIVMKRIVGRSLRQSRSRETGGPGSLSVDRLRDYLEVVVDVCHAVEYAHSRQIIHRDLKPDNIMVGDFGEVYVIDWGLGTYVGDGAPPADIERVDRGGGLAGTPGYMAPEMVEGRRRALTPKTDQYLLGGLLHFLITGESPHEGGTPGEVLSRAYESTAKRYPEDVPDELGGIVRRAMRRRPAERFPDVAAFRKALEGFFEHEHSRQMVRQADTIGRTLQRRLLTDGDAERDIGEIYRLFGEARFGYREAMASWEANAPAHDGLARLLKLGVEWALDEGSPETASMFLSEMSDPSAELRAEVREMSRRVEERKMEGLLFRESPNAVVVVDEEGMVTYVNRQLVEMFGYESRELLGEPVEVLMPERIRDAHADHLRRYMRSPESRPMGADLELLGATKQGEEFPIDIELNPVESDDGGLVMASIERLEPEGSTDSMVDTPTARAILRHLPQVVLAESDGRIVYANSRAVDLLGLDNLGALIGESLEVYLERDDGDDRPPTRGALLAVDGVRHPVRLSVEQAAFESASDLPEEVTLFVAEPTGD